MATASVFVLVGITKRKLNDSHDGGAARSFDPEEACRYTI